MSGQLTSEERETAFMQSAADRQRGVWQVFTCDPYWMKRLERYGKKLRTDGVGAWFEVEHRQITLRKPSHLVKTRINHGFGAKKGHVETTP